MKKILVMLVSCFGIAIAPTNRCHAQIEIIQEAIKAAIKAIDLQVQRLQNATIDLQNAQKAVENVLSQTKLAEITDWVDKHKQQYAEYFDELHTVKEAIRGFNKAGEIMQ